MKIIDRGCWTFFAAAALLAAPLAPAQAEEAVGLEAQGVDPRAALHPGGLDVRDELGRPVRASVIIAQLKAAHAEAAAQASYPSRLPKVATVTRMLELLQALTAWFSAGLPLSGSRALWALAPSTRGPQKQLLLCLLACLTTISAGVLRSQRCPVFPPAFHGAPTVLRC